jgi:tRNA 2-selenouridine synthase
MSRPGPVRVADRHLFDTLIDARSPSEYALDHIPGAINCPVLDDDERRIVGTLYKQVGAFEARRVGGAMVAANLARHLQQRFADKPQGWKPLVYCWRGGLRSGSMVTWLRMVGWDAQQLAGGYKPWRHHVIETIDRLAPQMPFQVVCGATGSAKTRVLQALQAQGQQVLDLEALAQHKGSMLGALPGQPQPSQKGFETQLATALEAFDLQRPVFVEAESRRIGRLALPTTLVERLRASPCVEIAATPSARLDYLLRDYAYLGDDRAALAAQLDSLKERHGKETVTRWQSWALQGQLSELFSELAGLHYDPMYEKSQAQHFEHWLERQRLPAGALDAPGIDALATSLAERFSDRSN